MNLDGLTEKEIDQILEQLKQRKREFGHLHSPLLLELLQMLKQRQEEQLRIAQKRLEIIAQDLVEVSGSQDTKRLKTPAGRVQSSVIERALPFLLDLEKCYFESRETLQGDSEANLSNFSAILNDCTRYTHFNTLASMYFSDSFFSNSSSIVSTIGFDKDDEFFATAGVSKKIKIFEYKSVVERIATATSFITQAASPLSPSSSGNRHFFGSFDDKLDTDSIGTEEDYFEGDGVPRYPVKEIVCDSKISCLSWNGATKHMMASSDYEGIVTVWDVSTGASTQKLNEHERRVWSVDFCPSDPLRIASGGDDSKANVCSVQYNTMVQHQLAFGSADHSIHYYDLRNSSQPLFVLKGHKKAVSYVKFLNSNQLLSASTDSTLKLWSLSDTDDALIRTYSGHMNEKNFVGLGVNCDGSLIACGSENNKVYSYYSQISRPTVSHVFGNGIDSVTGMQTRTNDPSQFISSVCWKRKTPNVLVCANSQGRIKVLELV